MSGENARRQILRAYGATGETLEELLHHNATQLDCSAVLVPRSYPLPDEQFVPTWVEYAAARPGRVFAALKSRLVQLNFPIQKGMSSRDDYIAATKRGSPSSAFENASGLILEASGQLEVHIHQSVAGRIPILYTPCRADFVSLVCALTMRNEAAHIPDSMGSCMVSGYNNWDRIAKYRVGWQAKNNASDSDWPFEFQKLIPQKHLYQDRFLVLSGGDYSGVPAAALGLSDSEWREKSLVIRREHECTHYFVRRVFPSRPHPLLEELIADYIGIIAAIGRFRADWVLHFMGLEQYPDYRTGGRLENYLNQPRLSDRAFRVLQAIFISAAASLERFTDRYALPLIQSDFRPLLITLLGQLTLEELADESCEERLRTDLQRLLTLSETTKDLEIK